MTCEMFEPNQEERIVSTPRGKMKIHVDEIGEPTAYERALRAIGKDTLTEWECTAECIYQNGEVTLKDECGRCKRVLTSSRVR